MDLVNQFIFIGALLILLSILAGMVSSRLGAPLLLVFLLLGMLAGEDGIFHIHFNDYRSTFAVGSIALAIILFEGGLRTPRDVVRLVIWPALSLATVGVLLSAVAIAGVAHLVMGFSPLEGVLLGAVVASTDAAAVFMLLHGRGSAVNARVTGTLELESGMNDPMAVFLTLLCVELLQHPDLSPGWFAVQELAIAFIGGGALGLLGGFALRWLVERLNLTTALYPILIAAGALLIFGGANLMGASGFLAVYVAGVMLARAPYRAQQVISRFLDGLAWLSQIAMFLLLGLLVTPSKLLVDLPAAIVIALAVILIARPGSVAIALLPFRFTWPERGFIAWVGLRGAVPIFLASIPILSGLPNAQRYFNVAFVVVLVSLLIQGWTVGRAARFLGLNVPEDETALDPLDLGLGPKAERELAGFRVKPGSRALRHTYGALGLPANAQILAAIRDEKPIEDFQDAKPEAGDYVIAIVPPVEITAAQRLFAEHKATEAEPEGFGEFMLSGDGGADQLALVYGLDLGDHRSGETLADFMHERLGKIAVVGDRVRIGEVELVVRAVKDGRVKTVGLELEDQREKLPARRAARRLRRRALVWSQRTLRAIRQKRGGPPAA
ncbi:potassium/proton antiporter [Dongia sedimenti]|uniref:Potassium/proton antiporter n=1 Tax=Dongia sedimenti TaxID=3064282 RepID=A0ABU0YSJ4_9PROT|nr:potassium/proton antiporter [Rhodospirillaceae bacterium R-7]